MSNGWKATRAKSLCAKLKNRRIRVSTTRGKDSLLLEWISLMDGMPVRTGVRLSIEAAIVTAGLIQRIITEESK
jgi:hypothetical protein